ncbi:MAG: excinuclease ABC subunit UvrA [Bacteroidales bacterium]
MKSIPIAINNASEHNLKSVTLEIPRNKLICVTGVSGSGKSSLVFDVLHAEGRRRYLETFSGAARLALGKLQRPEVGSITGLSPTIAINQTTIIRNARSTVGTMTGIYDLLRLLFARLATSDSSTTKPSRSLFSFNSEKGACPTCKGLGLEEQIEPKLFIGDPTKTLREGCIVMTTPSGYIVYSQVTMDVLNQVCTAHGFNVDIPWKELTEAQKNIVLYGSDKIKVPFGKHTLESRMKWSGITAKPREEGYYKGIVPVMEEILKRDRNTNILRFVESVPCSSCQGARLKEESLSFLLGGMNIAQLADLTLQELQIWTAQQKQYASEPVWRETLAAINKLIDILDNLGLSYLMLARESTSLSGGESQRIRLATKVLSGLQGVIYVIDEPSIGLHATEHQKLMKVLRELNKQGNTVIVIEHDRSTMLQSDWLIDIGPGAGVKGGEILYNGPVKPAIVNANLKPCEDYNRDNSIKKYNQQWIILTGASENNLKNIDVQFLKSGLNVVTGVSGAGKKTLVNEILIKKIRQNLYNDRATPGEHKAITGLEGIKKLVFVDQSPIGRTPRSNPATYTNLSDKIRDLFAALPESKKRGWKKGRFSFNNKGGRCETCQGAGVIQVGMHFLGDVDVLCETCQGKRFNDETLEVKWKGMNIYDVLELTVDEAVGIFMEEKAIFRYVAIMQKLGLGYITLGQPATTLSGGEAQRIKLSAELVKQSSGDTLYILHEPTTGLHNRDVQVLLKALDDLVAVGNTVLIITHHPIFIQQCDWLTELGPDSGKQGGRITYSGHPNGYTSTECETFEKPESVVPLKEISILGADTNNLQHINVNIPHGKITVITGISGSGKSSLAFDTLFAEGQRRYAENFSTWTRTRMNLPDAPPVEAIKGMSPPVAISQSSVTGNPRSTVGTMTEIYDLLRLAYARASVDEKGNRTKGILSSFFSFNHQSGACPECKGLGMQHTADPEKFVTHKEKSLLNGALHGSKTGQFYGDSYGQYVAILKAAGKAQNIDFSKPYRELSNEEKNVAMYGTGAAVYNVHWKYKRGDREGTHVFSGTWKGFVAYIDDEYNRKHQDKRGDTIRPLMKKVECGACHGKRLAPEALRYKLFDCDIAGMTALSIEALEKLWEKSNADQILSAIRKSILHRCNLIIRLGLGYLTLNRSSMTLSGGETQRLRLATQLGAKLTGITYILDEPTIGIHKKNTEKLLEVMRELAQNGNTLVVVEHDKEVMCAADYIIDMGPGAGIYGGKVVATGSPDAISRNAESLTGQYLQKDLQEIKPLKSLKSIPSEIATLKVKGAHAHNLKNISLQVPSGFLTVITGVSGSGKSTLMKNVIYDSFVARKAVNCDNIEGFEYFDEVVQVNQQMMKGQSNSTVLSWLGIWDAIRVLFAATPEAQAAGLKKGDFSFNSGKGRCETCRGTGILGVTMDFLSDVTKVCPDCHGLRFKEEVLAVKYKDCSIGQLLRRDVHQLLALFSEEKKIKSALQLLVQTGLGYLRAGQSLSTMSGGERQRIKLVKHIPAKGKVLFLLDEPTTGLHYADVEKLLEMLRLILKNGHTLLVSEHNEMLIGAASKVIELGPGGGDDGGKIINESEQ